MHIFHIDERVCYMLLTISIHQNNAHAQLYKHLVPQALTKGQRWEWPTDKQTLVEMQVLVYCTLRRVHAKCDKHAQLY